MRVGRLVYAGCDAPVNIPANSPVFSLSHFNTGLSEFCQKAFGIIGKATSKDFLKKTSPKPLESDGRNFLFEVIPGAVGPSGRRNSTGTGREHGDRTAPGTLPGPGGLPDRAAERQQTRLKSWSCGGYHGRTDSRDCRDLRVGFSELPGDGETGSDTARFARQVVNDTRG